jgi:hypothetical protein
MSHVHYGSLILNRQVLCHCGTSETNNLNVKKIKVIVRIIWLTRNGGESAIDLILYIYSKLKCEFHVKNETLESLLCCY